MGCINCCLKLGQHKSKTNKEPMQQNQPQSSVQLLRFQEFDNHSKFYTIKNQFDFRFAYNQGRLKSLIIIKSAQKIYNIMKQLPIYIWVGLAKQVKWESMFVNQMKEPLLKSTSVLETQTLVHENYSIILMSSIALASQIQFAFSNEKKVKKIFYLMDEPNNQQKVELKFGNMKKNIQSSNIFKNINELISFLKIHKQELSYQKPKRNFIFLEKDIWTSNILIQSFIGMSNLSSNRKQLMRQLEKLSKLLWVDSSERKKIEQFTKRAEKAFNFQEAIQWYTKQSFLSKLINNLLRIGRSPIQTFILQPFFSDLVRQIKNKYEEQKEKNSNFRCFRGGWISKQQASQFQNNVGKIVQNIYFLSTSKRFQVAKNNTQNLLIIINVNNLQKRLVNFDYGFAFLKEYSQFPEEQEILFNPFNNFKILKFERINKSSIYYQITLQYGSLTEINSKQVKNLSESELQLKKIAVSQIKGKEKFQVMGFLFRYFEEGCIEYWKKFTQLSWKWKNKEGYYFGLYYIAECQLALGNFSRCAEVLQTLKELTKYQQKQMTPAWILLMKSLGIVYRQLNQYPKAIFYLSKSVQLYQKKYNYDQLKELQEYASALSDLGAVYLRIQDFSKSLYYIKKSQIYDRSISLAIVQSDILARISRAEKDSQTAKLLLQNSKKIIKQFVGPEQILNIKLVDCLAVSYIEQQNYTQSMKILKQILPLASTLLKENDFYYILILNHLGLSYHYIGRRDRAYFFLDKSFYLLEKYYGQTNYLNWANFMFILLLNVYSRSDSAKLNILLRKLGKFQESLSNHICQKNPQILKRIGFCYFNIGAYDQSIKILEKNLSLCKILSSNNFSHYHECISTLCDCYQKQKKLKTFIEKISSFKKIYCQNEDCSVKLEGLIYLLQGFYYYAGVKKIKKARSLLKASLEILEKIQIQKSSLYFEVLQLYVQICIEIGELNEAIFYIKKGKILQLTIKNNHYYKRIGELEMRAERRFGRSMNSYQNNKVMLHLFQKIERSKHSSRLKEKFFDLILHESFYYPITL